ncbi:hypothetical protein MXB_2566, partial [Myxobolus squamalis]
MEHHFNLFFNSYDFNIIVADFCLFIMEFDLKFFMWMGQYCLCAKCRRFFGNCLLHYGHFFPLFREKKRYCACGACLYYHSWEELGLLVVLFTSSEKELLERSVIKLHDYSSQRHANYQKIIDLIQTSMDCCGWNNSDDWVASSYYMVNNKYPSSCCMADYRIRDCGMNINNINKNGCFRPYSIRFTTIYILLGFIPCIWAIFQIMLFSMMIMFVLRIGAWHYNDQLNFNLTSNYPGDPPQHMILLT